MCDIGGSSLFHLPSLLPFLVLVLFRHSCEDEGGKEGRVLKEGEEEMEGVSSQTERRRRRENQIEQGEGEGEGGREGGRGGEPGEAEEVVIVIKEKGGGGVEEGG